MRHFSGLAVVGLAATAKAATLAELCTVSNVQAALPANGTIAGIELIPSSVTATAVYNASTSSGGMMRKRQSSSSSSSTTTYSYCNVTATYTHAGKGDSVVVWYGFPDPSIFENRFYVSGGGGYSLASGVTGGLEYGAVTGCTDAGYDAFSNSLDEVVLYANGSLNWDNIVMVSLWMRKLLRVAETDAKRKIVLL
jgi:tannase